MIALSEKDPGETYPVAFTVSGLGATETITSATVACTVLLGTDATPSAVLSGAATINGATITQIVTGGISGVDYKLKLTLVTSGSRTLVRAMKLPVRTK